MIVEGIVSLKMLQVVNKDVCGMMSDTQLLVWGILSIISEDLRVERLRVKYCSREDRSHT